MTLYYAAGSSTAKLNSDDLRFGLGEAFRQLGPKTRVLAVPPDFTRAGSRAGELTVMAYEYFGERLRDVMPALGTHSPMKDWQIAQMFSGLPPGLIRVHHWRRDVVTVGEVPGDFIAQATEGFYRKPWPAQLNRLVWEGGHDLILSIGQVVPHEVIGMANYNKNLFVGTGGPAGINESHFLSAVYGMERIMGRADTPLRRILNYAHDRFCKHLPIVFVLSVVSTDQYGQLVTRGLFIGDDEECFQRACQLSREVNLTLLDEPLAKVVVYLDPEEFHSTWLGNKSVYRTRMAIANQGELVVLAPSVAAFGEDDQIDRLIRKYGYRTMPEILQLVRDNEDLRENLSAAAHLIHGSPEGRFQITYCPGKLTRDEIENVGYQYADLNEMVARYNPHELAGGWNELPSGERIYYISKPALGLWADRGRFSSAEDDGDLASTV
jgi:nickel-dependent lactate racemase